MTGEEQALLRAELEAAFATVASRWAARFEIVAASVSLSIHPGYAPVKVELRRAK